jgi:hypothetical protein
LPQIGFVNWNQKDFNTLQLGFVNTVGGSIVGVQFGFINYTDTIEKSIPIGFLSIVKNGGCKAIELGFSEISPFNLSFKIGVEKFYTSFIVGYNPFKNDIRKEIIGGAGFGSIIQLSKIFYFNPEITAYNRINGNSQQYVSIIPCFGYNVIPNLSIIIGPSVVWEYKDNDAGSPLFKIVEYPLNEENKLYFGARIALRDHW